MATDLEQIQSIRSLALAELEQAHDDPQPDYPVDGEPVSWTEYVESLQATLDWCDRKQAEYDPFEVQSRGTT